jgi:hypothetical protein
MANDPVPHPPQGNSNWLFCSPWPVYLAGLVTTVLGLLLSVAGITTLGVLVIAAGLLTTCVAVRLRFKRTSELFEDRVETAGMLAAAAFVALIGFLGMDEKWDAARLFLGVLTGVALAGAALVLVPTTPRRVLISLLAVFHFGGILSAVTSVPPNGQSPPWLSMQLWTHVYRPYLNFLFLNNAYHFYSPEPGPGTFQWFFVRFEDNTGRWYKIPNREESPVPQYYLRMLAMSDSITETTSWMPGWSEEDNVRAWKEGPVPTWKEGPGEKGYKDYRCLRDIVAARNVAGMNSLAERIPAYELDTPQPVASQFRIPSELAMRNLSSYARHVAHTIKHEHDPSIPVKSVKVYKVSHGIPYPAQLAAGADPDDPTYYMPFYMGEYDPEGNLLNQGKDPFLYWSLPIVYVVNRPREPVELARPDTPKGQKRLLNSVELHAVYQVDQVPEVQK